MLRFVEGPRLRFGSLPAKWLRCLGWFASATEIDLTGNSSSSTVQKVARAISQGRGRQCSVPPRVREGSGSIIGDLLY